MRAHLDQHSARNVVAPNQLPAHLRVRAAPEISKVYDVELAVFNRVIVPLDGGLPDLFIR